LKALKPALCALAMNCALAAGASPFIGAGDSFISYSSWDAAYCLGFTPQAAPASGFSTHANIGLDGIPFPRAWYELGAGYRWLDAAPLLSLPNASLRLGYRFPILPFMALSPFIGAELSLPLGRDPLLPIASVTAGLRASFRLHGKSYITISPEYIFPISSDIPSSVSLSASFRNEEIWHMADTGPDSGYIAAFPPIFSPDQDGVDDTVEIALFDIRRDRVKAWTLTVFSPDGTAFRTMRGDGPPPERIAWDGSSDSGAAVEPGEDFSISLELRSANAASTTYTGSATIDVLVQKDGERFKIRVPDINFPSNSYELGDATSRYLVDENRMVLTRIATLFKRFPGYSLTVEGHANSEHWANPEEFEKEQRLELQPLSELRAQAVKDALASLGVEEARIKVRAYGGTRPVYPFQDLKNAWKNRRVEFILSK
jgi:outer membrane protein OmpA-like peptidoglycan-associated protein